MRKCKQKKHEFDDCNHIQAMLVIELKLFVFLL